MANGASFNSEPLRQRIRKDLADILDSVRGKKILVLDPKLTGPLGLVAQASFLKEHGVESIFHLSSTIIQSEFKSVFYIVRPCMRLMKMISSQVKYDALQNVQRQHFVFLTRKTVDCEKVLEDEGIYSLLSISEFSFDFIPFEEDLISLQLESDYREREVDGNKSSLFFSAQALSNFQDEYGVFSIVKGKGHSSKAVADILTKIQKEKVKNRQNSPSKNSIMNSNLNSNPISTLILFDRNVDLVTPFCMQLTYEGIIDEFLNINNSSIEVDSKISGKSNSEKTKIVLNSSDKMFQELRNSNFGYVCKVLKQKSTNFRQDYADKNNKTVSELKDFVKGINSLPELERHTNLTHHIFSFTKKNSFWNRLSMEESLLENGGSDILYDYLEELMDKQESFIYVLRFFCLFSLTSGGMQRSRYEYLKREFLHTYGFEHLFTFERLEKAGLIKKQDGKNSWSICRRILNLIVENSSEYENQNDVSFAYYGYAPLSIRIIQKAIIKDGWKSIEEAMHSLPGPEFRRKQSVDGSSYVEDDAGVENSFSSNSGVGKSTVMIFFIGGITFAEISALRFLYKREDSKYDFIIATTKLINGSSLLESFVDDDLASTVSI